MGTLHNGRVRDPTYVSGSFVEVCLKISNSTKEWLQVIKSLKSFSCSPISIFLYWGDSQWKPKDILKTKQKLEFCNVKILHRHLRACTCNNSKLLTMKGRYVWYWKCSFLKALIINCLLLIYTWRVPQTLHAFQSSFYNNYPKHLYQVILAMSC